LLHFFLYYGVGETQRATHNLNPAEHTSGAVGKNAVYAAAQAAVAVAVHPAQVTGPGYTIGNSINNIISSLFI
jgi:hypothetical protein